MMNKKAQLDGMVKQVLWIILFLILLFGVYFLYKKLTNLKSL